MPLMDQEDQRAILRAAQPLTGNAEDFAPLLSRAARCRLVLLGEATHGTHEFYRTRAAITKRLILEHGFSGVAVEADWPEAWRVHRYVTGRPGDADATEALGSFVRFPQWMWRNADMLDFIGWLRHHNDALPEPEPRVGFFGLDLYSLHASIDAVSRHLTAADPRAAARARVRYSCFDHPGGATISGPMPATGLSASGEGEVLAQLREMRQRTAEAARANDEIAYEEAFNGERNAEVVHAATRYYRSMGENRTNSWNLRATHMADTLDALTAHLGRRRREAKIVVWAHNSHVGDARATQMRSTGELNVGQLMRQRWGRAAMLIGFTTYTGTVTAAADWDEPAESMEMRPAIRESFESLFHGTRAGNIMLDVRRDDLALATLDKPRLERAIGVIYRPEHERQSHYFHARLASQFDVVLHYDETRAVEPLERHGRFDAEEVAPTFPSAL